MFQNIYHYIKFAYTLKKVGLKFFLWGLDNFILTKKKYNFKKMEKDILEILFEQCKEIGKENNIKGLLNPDIDTKLFHSNGYLDSLGLVAFISGIEEKIADKFNIDILIVNEKAMSQYSSPFISVKSLSDYIVTLIKAEHVNE